MKELINKTGKSEPHLPWKLWINEHEVFNEEDTENEFNTSFTNIAPELAKKNTKCVKPIWKIFKKVHTTMSTDFLTINEVKQVFHSL